MAMKKVIPATNPDAYVKGLRGWPSDVVKHLRRAVQGAAKLDEVIKWGHLVYLSTGPVLLIRAEEQRVLFGFWRGQRLRDLEPRLKPGGKYEMATLVLHEGDTITAATARRLVQAAVDWNRRLGDPTDIGTAPRRARGLLDGRSNPGTPGSRRSR
ncbi:MAG: DUF1801 domain-containing protein [Candidatus Eisenbacteria bacterium]